jgi:hypothetical protein
MHYVSVTLHHTSRFVYLLSDPSLFLGCLAVCNRLATQDEEVCPSGCGWRLHLSHTSVGYCASFNDDLLAMHVNAL